MNINALNIKDIVINCSRCNNYVVVFQQNVVLVQVQNFSRNFGVMLEQKNVKMK